MTTYIVQAASAFAAGIGTSLSPCVYPMIPITVGYLGSAGKENSKRRILGFFIGQVLAFTTLGVSAVLVGQMLGFSSEIPAVQIATGCLLLVFAYFSIRERLPVFLTNLGSRVPQARAGTVAGAFLFGAASAAVASPCTSPVIGGMLTAISQVNDRWWGVSLMLFFAIGLSFLFLMLGLGLARVGQLPRAGAWMRRVHRASGVLLAIGGFYFIAKGLS